MHDLDYAELNSALEKNEYYNNLRLSKNVMNNLKFLNLDYNYYKFD